MLLQKIKQLVSHSSLLKTIILPIYSGKIIYWIYKTFNLKFSYSLLDKRKVKFFSKGQIAPSIFSRTFEKKDLAIFQKLLTPGSTMIDAGANIGLYSIIGSKLVGPMGRIFSFEPSKSNYNLFLKNIKLNKVENIVPINMGLGDKSNEILTLFQNTQAGDAEKYILRNKLNKNQFSELILMDTLDNFQSVNNIPKIDLLKIDVEGYEYYLLKGAKNFLKKNPKIIILFECVDHLAERVGATKKDVFTFLKDIGFDIVYWNKKNGYWSDDQVGAMKSGQLLGGKNITSVLNKLV